MSRRFDIQQASALPIPMRSRSLAMRPFRRPAWLASMVTALTLSSAGASRAQETAVGVVPDRPPSDGTEARARIDRTSLYGDDARVAAPMTLVASSSLSYTDIGPDPTYVSSPYPNQGAGCFTTGGAPRPCYSTFAGNTAQPGGAAVIAGELGLVPRLSVLGSLMVGFGGVGAVPSPDLGGTLALRYQALPSAWTHTHLVISGGYIREAYNPPAYDDDKGVWVPGQSGGINAGYLQVAMSGDIDRVRLGGMVHGQHTFADGRDPLDVMVDLGASYRITGAFRAGVEYVGQDLEETFGPGAEGGARHFAGPTVSLQLMGDRLTMVAGPSFGLSEASPRLLARFAVAYGF